MPDKNMDSNDIKPIISGILEKMGVTYDSIEDFSKENELRFNVQTKNSGILIGSRGEHISALNHIVKKIIGKKNEDIRISIDVNGYLEEANRALKNKVFILAERAKSFKIDVEMEPMSPYERMVVHSFLAADPHLETKSIGEGRNRRVVIKYKES
jgi:spoIIIJ-associated protein